LLAKLYRTGLITRRVPTKGFRVASYISSPFPKLAWRNVSSHFLRKTRIDTLATMLSKALAQVTELQEKMRYFPAV
jgi:hypothetical protein